MASHVIEIARQEGTEFRSVRLSLQDDGTITMDAQDIGPSVTQIWGDDDYEFWVRVPPTSLPKLAFELLRQKYERRWPGPTASMLREETLPTTLRLTPA